MFEGDCSRKMDLPLSPGQRSSSLAGGFAGSLSPPLPSGSSDLSRCAGTELMPPDINTERYGISKRFLP